MVENNSLVIGSDRGRFKSLGKMGYIQASLIYITWKRFPTEGNTSFIINPPLAGSSLLGTVSDRVKSVRFSLSAQVLLAGLCNFQTTSLDSIDLNYTAVSRVYWPLEHKEFEIRYRQLHSLQCLCT